MNITLPSQQRGASVTGVVFLIITLIVGIKLGLAIIPAYITDYQLTKSLTWELKKANDNKDSPKVFIANVSNQWNINGYSEKPEEIFTITNNTEGAMSIHKEYSNTANFFANVDIITHFKGDITAEDAKLAKP